MKLPALITSIILAIGLVGAAPASLPPRASQANEKKAAILPVAGLRAASKAAVLAKLGKPSTITKITNDPENMPGEYMQYELSGTHGVDIRMKNGRLRQINITCDPTAPDLIFNLLGFAGNFRENARGGTRIYHHLNGPDKSVWGAVSLLSERGGSNTELINLVPQ